MSRESAQALKEFLSKNRITISELSRASNVTRASFYKYLEGSNVHPNCARKIEKGVLENFKLFLPKEKLLS